MNKQGTIYKIENLVNGKVYIGQTINNPKNRLNDHKSMLRRNAHDNSYLQNAWNKHSEKNFEFKVINKYPISQLDEIEISLISKYNNLGKCYNLESGGNTLKQLHKDTKIKLSEVITEKWKDEEYIHKMKESLMKKVICINTGVIYDSVVEVSKLTGIKDRNIYQGIRNQGNVMGIDGKYYQFAHYREGKVYKLKTVKKDSRPKKVVCVNTGEIFESTREASKATNAQQSKISLCCNGKRNFAGKLDNGDWIKWVFEEDYDINKEYSLIREGRWKTP